MTLLAPGTGTIDRLVEFLTTINLKLLAMNQLITEGRNIVTGKAAPILVDIGTELSRGGGIGDQVKHVGTVLKAMGITIGTIIAASIEPTAIAIGAEIASKAADISDECKKVGDDLHAAGNAVVNNTLNAENAIVSNMDNANARLQEISSQITTLIPVLDKDLRSGLQLIVEKLSETRSKLNFLLDLVSNRLITIVLAAGIICILVGLGLGIE